MKQLTSKDLDEMDIFVKYNGYIVPLVGKQVTVEREFDPCSVSGFGWDLKVEGYCSLNELKDYIPNRPGTSFFLPCLLSRSILKVIFNDPATIVFWCDGTKTVVKCQENDKYDKMTGLAMAISKKAFGNKGRYYDIFKKWCEEDA